MAHIGARITFAAAVLETVIVTDVRVYLERVAAPTAARELILVKYQLNLVSIALAPLLGIHALCTTSRLDDLWIGGLRRCENALGGSEIAVEVGVEPH